MKKHAHSTPPAEAARREPLTREVAELTAERLKVLGDATRILLFEALNTCGEADVQELADSIGVSHQLTSKHLVRMWRAGLLARRQDGPFARYSIDDWTAWWVIEQIARWVESCQSEQVSTASSP